MTAVVIAPLRGAAVRAKTAATLDVLSQGRLDLGVGVGWLPKEYEAAGLSFSERGRLLDDVLEVSGVRGVYPLQRRPGFIRDGDVLTQIPGLDLYPVRRTVVHCRDVKHRATEREGEVHA